MDTKFYAHVVLTEQTTSDFVKISNLTATGGDLGPFYRPFIWPDRLLATHQIIHLHLGGPESHALVYVVQYPEHILFVTVDTHRHLETELPGIVVRPLGRKTSEASLRAAAKKAKVDKKK